MDIPDNLSAIATIIQKDWKIVNSSAVPYLQAMHAIRSIEDHYGAVSGRAVVVYFLGNARTWRGDTAKAVKAKLNHLLKS